MYQVIGRSENRNVGIKIEKKLTPDDYQLLIPYIDRLQPEAGTVNLLCDVSECEGPTNHTIWGDLVDRLLQSYEIPRVAVVIDERQGKESKINMPSPGRKTSVKYFSPAHLDKAWNWVEGAEMS